MGLGAGAVAALGDALRENSGRAEVVVVGALAVDVMRMAVWRGCKSGAGVIGEGRAEEGEQAEGVADGGRVSVVMS